MKKSVVQKLLAAAGLIAAGAPGPAPFNLEGVNYVTYNYRGGVVAGISSGVVQQPGMFTVVDVLFDMAKIATARTAAGQAAIAAADVLEVVPLLAGTWVPAAFVQVLTAEGAAGTMGVGDGTAATGFMAAVDLNTVGWSSSLITTAFSLATAGGKLYAADDTIDLTINTAAVDVAKFRLIVVAVDLRTYRM